MDTMNLRKDDDYLRLWKTAFPDPATFPACCAKCLFIRLLLVVTTMDKYRRGWLDSDIFSHVTLRYLWTSERRANISALFLIPSYGFSPITKARAVPLPAALSKKTFDLINSFPLVEDLSVKGIIDLV